MNTLQAFNLSGKTALVTGCNKGIGKSMAVGLAEAGADIIGVSGSLELKGSEVENSVVGLGRRFKPFRVDLSNRDELYRFIEQVSAYSAVDILVNNAGIIKRSPAIQYSDDDWDAVLALNLDSPFILARELGKEMIGKKSGKIIFTCSLLSFQGGISVPAYAASKGALASLVKALANEWASQGINVNGIAPGYIETDNTAALRNDQARLKTILDRIPAGRFGQPDELKGAVVFLASDAANYVNGTLLTVDGGWMGR